MGAGHDSAARVLADRLRERGAAVDCVDVLTLPRWHKGEVVRGFYRLMISRAPAAYGFIMATWMDHPGFFERVTAAGAGDYERGLAERVESVGADVVVSTYNLGAQALGRLRAAGRITVPVISYVTDPGAHPYWVAPGIDSYVVPLPQTACAMRELGADPVTVAAPLVDVPPVDREEARDRWDLPDDCTVVLVNGGSWGVGSAAHTAEQLSRVAGVLPVVLCGRSERLGRRVEGLPGCRAVPWTDDAIGLLAASDVVVDNAGGTTCWEALALRRPVVLHRPIPGHGRLNVATLVAAGLATRTDDPDELAAAVRDPRPPVGADAVFAAPDVADLVADAW